jgi:hypothetical protein
MRVFSLAIVHEREIATDRPVRRPKNRVPYMDEVHGSARDPREETVEVRFPHHWAAICKLKPLADGIPKERLSKLLDFLVERGEDIQPRAEAKHQVIDSIIAAGQASKALSELSETLEVLGDGQRTEYDSLLAQFSDDQDGDLLLAIEDLIKKSSSLAADIDVLRLVLGLSVGSGVRPSDAVKPKSDTQRRHLGPIALPIILAWEVITGKDVRFSKDYTKDGIFGRRPRGDDAYFVYLCLNMITGIRDPAPTSGEIRNFVAMRRWLSGAKAASPRASGLGIKLMEQSREILRTFWVSTDNR